MNRKDFRTKQRRRQFLLQGGSWLRAALALVAVVLIAAAPSSFPPTNFPDSSNWGCNVQRTMRLLATSTPENRHTVRILFYGQSITEQNWTKLVADDLRQHFPHANLVIENPRWAASR